MFRKKAQGPDRRLAPRETVQVAAAIVLPNGRDLGCSTLDLSYSGARLLLRSQVLLPASVEVRIPVGSPPRRARVVWRSADAVGLQFAPA